MEKISIRLGKNLKKIRTEKGMSQGDIARKLKMDRSYISGIENGRRNPTIANLERLANALDVPVEFLLK